MKAFPLPADQLIDLAWSLDKAQLREAFGRRRDEGLSTRRPSSRNAPRHHTARRA
jgi:hypothetical protein